MSYPDNHKTEISRFNGGGKTFFFNKRKARNDTDYLAINAIWGKEGRFEKLVLFPQHLLEFSKHLAEAVEDITGFTQGGGGRPLEGVTLPSACSKCDALDEEWGVHVGKAGDWNIQCKCGNFVYTSKQEDNDGARQDG